MTLTRREFLKTSGLAAVYLVLPTWLSSCSSTRAAAAAPPLADPTAWAGDRAAENPALLHMLQRLTYGPAPGDLNRVGVMGIDAFIDQQLHPQQIDDSAMEQRLADFNTLTMSSAELYEAYPPRKKDVDNTKPAPMVIVQQLEGASLLRAVYSQRQLQEIMVDFWSSHFSIYIGKNQIRWLKTADDRDAIRPNALGKFRDLLLASAKSPAMLMYLDNDRSTADRALGSDKGGVNENYARELMELHTIGADAGYDHDDIVAVARALTGWSISRQNEDAGWGSFRFRPRLHDNEAKQIKVLDLDLPAGGGMKEGETLLARLAADPRTAQRIAQKLCMRFVSDNPPADLVSQAAQTFLSNDGDIAATLGVILHSDAFKESAGQKIKLPLHALASMLRATGAEITNVQPFITMLRQLGQPFFGWQAPNGYPQVGAAWVNTSGMLARWNSAFAITAPHVNGATINLQNLLAAHGLGSTPTAAMLVDAATDALLHAPVSDDARATLIDYVSAGGGATKTIPSAQLARKLSGVTGLVLASPVFQTF